VDAENPGVKIIHRGKYKSLSKQERRMLKRRQAIEPLIGHTKADHRMDRCWLRGELGDALHALSCAAGYNIRWLMRAIARLGVGALLFALAVVILYGGRSMQALRQVTGPMESPRIRPRGLDSAPVQWSIAGAG
jgi:transposase, IS5 family